MPSSLGGRYGGKRYRTQNFLIPEAALLSAGVDLRAARLVGLDANILNSANLTFLASQDAGVTFLPVYDATNTLIAYTVAPNLVTNGGFEVDTAGWTATAGATIVQSGAEAKAGSFSGLIDCDGLATDQGAYDDIALGFAKKYTFSAWVKSGTGGVASAISIRTSAGALKAETTFVSTTAFQRVQVSWVADATASHRFQVGNNAVVAETYFIDEVEVAENQYHVIAEDDARGLRGFVKLGVDTAQAADRIVVGVIDDGD